jgi:hypothetical protein
MIGIPIRAANTHSGELFGFAATPDVLRYLASAAKPCPALSILSDCRMRVVVNVQNDPWDFALVGAFPCGDR